MGTREHLRGIYNWVPADFKKPLWLFISVFMAEGFCCNGSLKEDEEGFPVSNFFNTHYSCCCGCWGKPWKWEALMLVEVECFNKFFAI